MPTQSHCFPGDQSRFGSCARLLVGTSGVGVIIEVGTDVPTGRSAIASSASWTSASHIITVDRPADFIWPGFAEPSPWVIWELGDLDPLTALCFEPAYVAVNTVRESQVRFGDAGRLSGWALSVC